MVGLELAHGRFVKILGSQFGRTVSKDARIAILTVAIIGLVFAHGRFVLFDVPIRWKKNSVKMTSTKKNP